MDLPTCQHIGDLVAAFLLTNGKGQVANRLVLTVDAPQTYDIGSWDRATIQGAVVSILAAQTGAGR